MAIFSSVISKDPLQLIPPVTDRHKQASQYVASDGLREAIDVAMLLGEPLLLTGDPGVGKTRAAYWLAEELYGPGAKPLRHDVKSTTSGVDLLYTFDEVGRFRDGARGETRPLIAYLRFNPLGEAILRAAGGQAVLETASCEPLEGPVLARHEPLLRRAFGVKWAPKDGKACASAMLPDEPEFADAGPAHCLVLVDELDKAPRDTPNDLLVEVDEMRFLIPELGLAVVASPTVRPIVLITTNSEKALPEPFLRRCCYFDVPPPDDVGLRKIIEGSVEAYAGGGPLIDQAMAVWRLLRDPKSELRHPPGVSDLLAWLEVLARLETLRPNDSLAAWVKASKGGVARTLPSLIKLRDDRDKSRNVIQRWTQT